MSVDWFSGALIEFFVSQIHELVEIKMIVSKPELRRQTKRERSRAFFTPQLLYKAMVTRWAIRNVHGNSFELIFC
jgi:hypothetical protein